MHCFVIGNKIDSEVRSFSHNSKNTWQLICICLSQYECFRSFLWKHRCMKIRTLLQCCYRFFKLYLILKRTTSFFSFQTVTLTHHGLRSPMEYSCEEIGSIFRVPTVSRSLWSGRCPAPLSKTCEKTKRWLSQLKSAAVFRCFAWSPTSIVSRFWNLHWRVSFFF